VPAERDRAGHVVDLRVGQLRGHGLDRLGGEPGGEHRALGVRGVQGAEDLDDLRR